MGTRGSECFRGVGSEGDDGAEIGYLLNVT